MFSATWDNNLDALSRKYLKQATKISAGVTSRSRMYRAKALTTSIQDKNEALLEEINRRKGSVLVFVRTQRRTDRLARYLDGHRLGVGRIHGGRTQGQRTSALSGFKAGHTRILVATDIAARGIDVSEIAHVINYDLPQVPEDYIHRIGRTGRAGFSGQALSFITPEERPQWNEITRLLQKTGSPMPQLQASTARAAITGRLN